MGISVETKGSDRSHWRRGRRHHLMSEINVTPFVDVMLVLLIVFMVAAPLLTVGVPIDLPETDANALNSETQPLTISVNDEGRIYLQETEIELKDIVAKLQQIAKTGYEERIYVRGDRSADYGSIMRVMARISSAGFHNLGLVTLQEQEEG